VINGEKVRSVLWFYGMNPYSLEYSIKTSEMFQYLKGGQKGSIERWPGDSADSDLVSRYVNTSQTDALNKLIADLAGIAESSGITDDISLTNFIMAFVQYSIRYESDYKTAGSSEYWKYPTETLYSGVGDCEDVALLTMALLKGVFRSFEKENSVALALYWGRGTGEDRIDGHAMAAIELSTAPTAEPASNEIKMEDADLYKVDGITYYVCETVSKGWRTGWIGLNYSDVAPDHLIVI